MIETMFTKMGGFASISQFLNFGNLAYQALIKKQGVAGALA
jgi:hypothetical protein